MTLGNRIKTHRKRKGLSQLELSELCGWDGSARISNYERNAREPILDDIEKIANALQIEKAILLGTDEFFELDVSKKLIPKGKIPLLEWSKSYILSPDKEDIITPHTIFIPLIGPGSLKSYALKIENDSMISPYPGIKSFYPGEIIIVDPEKLPQNGDFVVVCKEDSNEATFKQYIIDTGIKLLRSLNQQYMNTIAIDPTIRICGVVIAKMDYIV